MEGEWANHSVRMIVENEIFSKRKPTKKKICLQFILVLKFLIVLPPAGLDGELLCCA